MTLTAQEPWAPSADQLYMLRACLSEGDDAIRWWREWVKVGNMDLIDRETYKLFARLYTKLQRAQLRDPIMGRLKGIYRRTWYKNQVLFDAASDLLRALRAAGIDTMLLKGAALVPLYYKDYGVRALGDVDVMVPMGCAGEAIGIFESKGWRSAWPMDPALMPFRHGIEFRNEDEKEVDLHWHSLWQCWDSSTEADFWRDALKVEVKGIPTRALKPADQLIHVCVHGIQWDPIRTLNWIVDAMTLMTSADVRIEWPQLVERAMKHQVVLPVRKTLAYLADTFGAPVPPDVMQRLNAAEITETDRLRYELTTQPQSLGRVLRRHRFHYEQSVKAMPDPSRAIGFARYLALHVKGTQHAKSWGELPGLLAGAILRRTHVLRGMTVRG